MSESEKRVGKCLCGAVEIAIPRDHQQVGTCHCSMCRGWASGPMMAIHVRAGEAEIRGSDHITAYRSSDWGERSFCRSCGSNLYYRLVRSGDMMVSAGLFGDAEGLSLTSQIFIEEKPPYYDFANDTPKLTGAEVFAMYASQDGEEER